MLTNSALSDEAASVHACNAGTYSKLTYEKERFRGQKYVNTINLKFFFRWFTTLQLVAESKTADERWKKRDARANLLRGCYFLSFLCILIMSQR
jgi:hypothetical protein